MKKTKIELFEKYNIEFIFNNNRKSIFPNSLIGFVIMKKNITLEICGLVFQVNWSKK